MAIDYSIQVKGLEEVLLCDALQRAILISREIEIYAVQVQAIDGTAASFYHKFGFASYRTEPLDLYMPLSTITTVPFNNK
jgi:hypothetical protein